MNPTLICNLFFNLRDVRQKGSAYIAVCHFFDFVKFVVKNANYGLK
jgi:hypothetical protein